MAEDRPGPRIPLFIDDVKDEDGFQMTRSVYLSIESTGIPREWHLEFDSQDLPFLLLDGAGVIYCPDRATERFEDADQINQLISTVETHPDLLVESEDLWLPTSVFEERPAPGDVFRAPFEIFRAAHLFQSEQLTLEELRTILADQSEARVLYSKEETEAFRIWSELQLEEARRNYREQRERGTVLARRDP